MINFMFSELIPWTERCRLPNTTAYLSEGLHWLVGVASG